MTTMRFRAAATAPIALAAILLAMPIATALAGDWNEVTKEGVLHVENPGTPAEPPMTVELEEEFRLGGDTDDEDQIFGVITVVRRDDEGNSYLLDSQLNEVRVFSDAGEFVDVIGREGEGPGEFRNPNTLLALPNGNWGVMQLAPGRIAQMTSTGEPMSDYPIPSAEAGGFVVLRNGDASDDRVFLTMQRNSPGEGKFSMAISLDAIDDEGNITATYHTDTRELVFAEPVIDEEIWDTFDRRWAPTTDGRLFAVLRPQNYKINVWNVDGSVDRIVEREYTALPRSEEELERTREIYKRFTAQLPNAEIKVSDDAPAIHTIHARDDGSIWVLSGRGARQQPDGAIGTFDVFSPEGHFVRQVTLIGEGDPMSDQYIFEKDRLYVITGFLDAAMSAFAGGGSDEEDDDYAEPLEVICYELDDDAVAMR